MSRLYTFLWFLTVPFFTLFYPRKTSGRAHIPSGGALFCANHSAASDPFFVAYGLGFRHQIHFMAKMELFNIPLLGALLRTLGTFPVDRRNGAAAIKSAMRLLKDGKKVLMFPEGTRSSTDDTTAKTGAIRIATQMGAAIVPVYIPRKKKPFRLNRVLIGEPYVVALNKKTATAEDYAHHTAVMMNKIKELGRHLT